MNLKKPIALLTAVFLASTVFLSACGKEGGAGTEEESGPLEISIFSRQNAPEATEPDNFLLKELEKLTNTKLNITWVPVNTLGEKTKVTIASGDIPDLMYIENPFDALFVQSAEEGAFWDVAPYIQDYPLLSAFPEAAWKNTKINGKNYGIPRPRPVEGGGSYPLIRKDWLDKLGMSVPLTAEDYYKVAKAFAHDDPDGNGQADTYGIIGDVSAEGMGTFNWIEQLHTGITTGEWALKDGELSLTALDPGIRDALEYLKRLYDEKIIPADFAVMKNSQARDAFMGNKGGILGAAISPQWLFMEALLKIVPTGDILPVSYLQGPNGPIIGKSIGYLGMYAIPKTVPEAKMKKLLEFMNKSVEPEIAAVAKYGLKDVHYTSDGSDDLFVTVTEQAQTDNIANTANNLNNIFTYYNKYQYAYYGGIPKDHFERNKQIIDERAKYSVDTLPGGMISETWLLVGPDMKKKIQDMKIKVIMGKETLSAWDTFVEGLKSNADLIKATKEINEAYQAAQ